MDPDDHLSPIKLVIELKPGSEPIEGEVIEPRIEAGEFRGWLALTSLIDSLRNRERERLH